jgi:hypothetical protein
VVSQHYFESTAVRFTTLICILWLDHALFNANQNVGIIAQTDPIAEEIFRDKIKFTYDNLPQRFLSAIHINVYHH